MIIIENAILQAGQRRDVLVNQQNVNFCEKKNEEQTVIHFVDGSNITVEESLVHLKEKFKN